MPRPVRVAFPVSREAAFDYLVDPHRRTEWQATLRRVHDVEPLPPQVGTAWRETAVGGVVSDMRLTAVDRPARWAEEGRSRGVRLTLSMTFEDATGGCAVTCDLRLSGQGRSRVVAAVMSRLFPLGARRDLARAARLLAADNA